ncbi:23357_t:CDS:2 [Gigaspora rosea]|nr:23357_t:CDS:2 [Gigaspora rosea]
MEVLGNYLGPDFDFIKAVNKFDSKALEDLILANIMELSITNIMSEIHYHLPDNWNILYLGHCRDKSNNFRKQI